MSDEETSEGLLRELPLVTATTVVVGTVIGSGIFVGANRVAGGVGSIWAMFAVWIGAGLLTLLGALTYAEFGAMYPRSGSDYVYVTKSLGPRWGFLAGWSTFSVNLPASLAYLALAFTVQADVLKPSGHADLFFAGFSTKFTAIGILVLFTIINYFGAKQGGVTQRVLTFGKVGLMMALVALALFSSNSDFSNFTPFFADQKNDNGRFIYAVVAALFAFDGWNSVTRVTGEIKDPQRVIPRALTFGVLSIILIYVIMNSAYLLALGLGGMSGADPSKPQPIASNAAQALIGPTGNLVVAVIVATSILGTINGLTLSGPRVYFAMARDRLFPPIMAKVHAVHRTPYMSIVVQTILSVLLILFVPFPILQNYVVLGAWFNYALTGIGLLRHRRTHPDLPRPYRVPLYPWVPIGFVGFASLFLSYLLLSNFFPTFDVEGFIYFAINVLVLALGVVFYEVMRRKEKDAPPVPS